MNNTCDSFLFWYTRPFAEMLAGLTVVALAVIVFIAYQFYDEWKRKRKSK